MSKFEKNLSDGNVAKKLILFSLPFLLSNIIQSLYNVVDMVIVGKFSGPISISGVNNGGQVTLLLTNFILGLCLGGSVLVAQYLGAKNKEKMEETIGTLFSTLIIASIVITIGMFFLQEPILRLIKTPEVAFNEAKSYLFITVLGVFFIFGYNALSSIMRGMGDSKTPLYFVSIACIINIVLDLIFVGSLKMGASGAALATIISQAISMILCILYLIKNKFIFDFKIKSFKINPKRLQEILKIGIPSSIQNVVVGISFLIITAVVNTMGVSSSAAVGVVGKFNGFAIMPSIAIAMSVSSMAAQNIGANKMERAKETLRVGIYLSLSFSIIIFFIAQLFPKQILSIFSSDPEMIEMGTTYIRTFSFDYIIVPAVFCLNGLFTGAGHSMFSLVNNVLSSIILRVPAAIFFGLTLNLGLFGIGLGAPIASFGSLILALYFYYSGKWKNSENNNNK